MKKVNVVLVFVAALLLSCTTVLADGGTVYTLRITDTSYNKVLSSTSKLSPSNLGELALNLYYDEGNAVSGNSLTNMNVEISGVEIRTYDGKYVLQVIDQYEDYHYVGYFVGNDFHIYWSDSHPGDVFIDEDASFSEQIARTLEGIARQVSRIDQALTSENGPFALWMSLLDTDLDLVNINLEQISLKVQSVVDYTNVIANGTVTLVEKMDDLIEAVNGISISADGATINFDTLPITNKLDDVITAIEDISINVEGGTVNFDTNPITDKLDEVIDAIHGISVTGGGSCVHEYETVPFFEPTCTASGLTLFKCRICNYIGTMIVPPVAHTWEVSDQTTYRTVLPLRSYDYVPRSDTRSEWALIDSFWPVVNEWYQVIYNGVEYYVMAWEYPGREFGNVALGNRNYVYDDTTVTETTYPFTIVWSGLEEVGAGWVELRSFTQEPFTLSIAKLDTIPTCSVCGKNEDTVSLVGAIEHATAVLQSAILSTNGDPAVSGDYSDLISSLEHISAKLEQNHDEICFGLSDFFQWVTTDSLIAPCEHSYMPVVMVEPSCDFPGVTKFTCEYCGTFRVELSEPLGHEWMDFAPPEPVALMEDAPFGLIDGSSPPMLGNMALIALTLGEQYRVIYNGIEYITECTMLDYNGLQLPVIGNVDAFLGIGDNGCPFVLASSDLLGGTGCFDFSGATTATVSVYTVPDEVEGVPEYLQPLHICSRCDSGHNLAGVMEFLDERLTSSPGGGSDLTPVLGRLDTIIENMGVDLGDAGCDHVYVTEVNQEQTCVLPGLQTHTCELCGSSYSEILESLGHDWQCTAHVEDELDPETGEVISSGYDIYTCSICDDTYNDYDGNGAPEDGSTSITGIVSRVFEKIGSLVGELLAMGVRLLDNLLTGFDEIVTSFNEKTQQIVSFGSGYTAWLSGFWGIVPSDLQLALSFCVVVICLGIIGKKLVFAS